MKKAITTVKTVVNAIKDGGTGIKVFTLVDPDCWEFSPFKPGTHNNLHLPDGFVRTYSLCKPPVNARYVVAFKREVHGLGGSIALHDKVSVGDTIGVSLPRGGIAIDIPAKRYIFVAGGIGVMPFLSRSA